MAITDTLSPCSTSKVDISSESYPYTRSVVLGITAVNLIAEEYKFLYIINKVRILLCTSTCECLLLNYKIFVYNLKASTLNGDCTSEVRHVSLDNSYRSCNTCCINIDLTST